MVTNSEIYKSPQIKELNHIRCGTSATVVALRTEQELLGRLMGLGLFVGTKVRLLQGGCNAYGPLLLSVGNTRIALGRDIADSILVEES